MLRYWETTAKQTPVMSNIPVFQLLQWKYAIRLQMAGMKHSSGRSVRRHAAIKLGLKPNSKGDVVIAKIQEKIDAATPISG